MAQMLIVTLVELGKCCLLSIYLYLPIFFFFPNFPFMISVCSENSPAFQKIPLTFEIKKKEFSSVPQLCPALCNSMDCSTPGLPVHQQLPEFTQTHVHPVGNAIQPSHPLSSLSPPTFNLSQHQGLFKWASSSHQVAEVLEFQLQHQSFQWTFITDFL